MLQYLRKARLLVILFLTVSWTLYVPDQRYKSDPLSYPYWEITTLRDLRFNSAVYCIGKAPSGTDLLVCDAHSVWRVDLKRVPPTKTLIAGSNTAGYLEGTGISARFNAPVAARKYNTTSIIVADSRNNCLRLIDIFKGTTSMFVGRCLAPGWVDGDRSVARMSHPYDIIQYQTGFFICDLQNNAIRLLAWDRVKTVFRGNPVHSPRSMAMIDDELYVTVSHAVVKLNPASKVTSMVSGFNNNVAFEDGKIQTSRYHTPFGISVVTKQSLVIADHGNHRLRVLDLKNSKVSSVCDGVAGFRDEDKQECRLSRPLALYNDGNVILIGEGDGYLRTLKSFNGGKSASIFNKLIATTIPPNIPRDITLQAQYKLQCSMVNDASVKAVINTLLYLHSQDIVKYCPNCKISANPPRMTCSGDVVSVTWTTNLKTDGRVMSASQSKILVAILKAFQSLMKTLRTNFLSLTILGQPTSFRTLLPIADKDGLMIRPIVS